MKLGANLPGKEKVTKYKHAASKKPLVSVSVVTYRHEKYIAQCLDSILSQKTDFDFEILLGEDDSPDATRSICVEYAKKHPDKIRLFLHDRSNVIYIGDTPTGRYNALFNFLEAKGKYIAQCEGDDYWTDPLKLQRQVDFMEAHPDYSLCFHPTEVVHENEEQKGTIFPAEKSGFSLENLLQGNFMQNCSVMYRKTKYTGLLTNVMPGDWYMHLWHAKEGKIGFIDKVMSVYRKHEGGIWWSEAGQQNRLWAKHGAAILALFVELNRMFGDDKKTRSIIQDGTAKMTNNIIGADAELGANNLERLLQDSQEAAELVKSQNGAWLARKREATLSKDKIVTLEAELLRLKANIRKSDEKKGKLQRELDAIVHSKTWRLRSTVVRLLRGGPK